MDWIRAMRKSTAVEDKKNFMLWEIGRISTRECWERFKWANHLPCMKYRYNKSDFERWLNGLGYIRKVRFSLDGRDGE